MSVRFEKCPAEGVRWHPYAEIFPWMEGDAFDQFKDDVRQRGVIEPIVMFEGQILDGRNRYMAARDVGIEYPVTDYEGNDPLGFVIAKNMQRRHLTDSQRAMAAAKIAKLPRGSNQHSEGPSIEGSSKLMNVSVASVERAKVVQRDGAPELVSAVEQGKIAVSTAAELTVLDAAEQAQVIAMSDADIVKRAKEIHAQKRRARFATVTESLALAAKASVALPSGQRYPIIYADPATKYVAGFSNRSTENHYPTMTTEELCALRVDELALDDAVLFIWSTIPQLRNTMTIIEAWGFNYVSAWCWDKEVQGTGHWAFNEHEELLIGTRGNFPAPVPGTQPRSMYHERKAEHSSKPDWYAEQIERIWPTLPKIELFARGEPRRGWAAWGNQLQQAEDAA